MMSGLLGRKLGMTQIFTEIGAVVPVTVVEAGPCAVLEVMDGKGALKVGYGEVGGRGLNKPREGYFKKIGQPPRRYIREIAFDDPAAYQPGQELKADLFSVGDYVDVTGRSKGRGFSGVIKRWGHSRFPESHGHGRQRLPGSLGCSATPGHVVKGKKLPGRYGGKQRTVQSLEVVGVRAEENLLLIKGAVPGCRSGVILIRKAIKKKSR